MKTVCIQNVLMKCDGFFCFFYENGSDLKVYMYLLYENSKYTYVTKKMI